MNKEKVVVIGTNHAGTTAIKTLLLENPKIDVTSYEINDNISFLGCGIALAVGGIVKNTKSLFYATPESLKALGAKIHMQHEVTKIDYEKKVVEVKNLKTNEVFIEQFTKLIYACGSWPIIFPFHTPNLKGVKLCKNYEHALSLIEDAKKSEIKKVSILGAGYIGIELAEAFRDAKKDVTLIDMQNRVIPRYFDKEFTNPMEASMRDHGINLVMDHVVEKIESKEDGTVIGYIARNVLNNEIKKIDADLIISCVGFRPNSKLLTDAINNVATIRNGAIKVNEKCQALDKNNKPIDDIYVVGDCAAIKFAPNQQHENVALATNAVKAGIVAASHINTSIAPNLDNIKLENVAGTNAICVFGFNYSSTGVSEDGAKAMGLDVEAAYHEGDDRCEFYGEKNKQYCKVQIKLVYEKKTLRLVGAQIGSCAPFNHTEVNYFLALAIQKNMTLFDLATVDFFFLPHFNKPLNFILCVVTKALGLKFDDHKYLVE